MSFAPKRAADDVADVVSGDLLQFFQINGTFRKFFLCCQRTLEPVLQAGGAKSACLIVSHGSVKINLIRR